MKPIDFVAFGGDSRPNTPVGDIYEAVNHSDLVIRSASAEWRVLSYYYNDKSGSMVLDIQEI